MKKLNTSRIIVGMLLAATLFCSLKTRESKAATQPATISVETSTCPCEKPQTLDKPLNGSANIVARMLEI